MVDSVTTTDPAPVVASATGMDASCNGVTDAENSTAVEETDARAGGIGEIPAYHIMDFSLTYLYKQRTIESGINNLTNRNYFTRRATGYPGPGIIPSDQRSFYLTLGIRL